MLRASILSDINCYAALFLTSITAFCLKDPYSNSKYASKEVILTKPIGKTHKNKLLCAKLNHKKMLPTLEGSTGGC